MTYILFNRKHGSEKHILGVYSSYYKAIEAVHNFLNYDKAPATNVRYYGPNEWDYTKINPRDGSKARWTLSLNVYETDFDLYGV